jgi:hypothetical protein
MAYQDRRLDALRVCHGPPPQSARLAVRLLVLLWNFIP